MANPLVMLVDAISTGALKARGEPGKLREFISQVEGQVTERGKYKKLEVLYVPFSPPPFFWDYKCKKCLWWELPNGCKVVEGRISSRGWCVIWVPPGSYEPFTWPQELIRGEW